MVLNISKEYITGINILISTLPFGAMNDMYAATTTNNTSDAKATSKGASSIMMPYIAALQKRK